MDTSRLVKLVLVIALVAVAWKYGVPWVREQAGRVGKPTAAASMAGNNSCIPAAERASDAWGNGIGRFANPPYDVDAWSSFAGDVNAKIGDAESACSAQSDSCAKARDAMRDLRSLVSDLDRAIRSGAPPSSDIVQRQGAVDAQLDAARELVKSGK